MLIDGDHVSSLVIRNGRYRYVSALRAIRTVEMWIWRDTDDGGNSKNGLLDGRHVRRLTVL